MRLLGFILLACLVITGLRALVTVLAVAAIALLAYGIAFQPSKTIAVISTLACWSVVIAFPGVALGLLALGVGIQWWQGRPPA